MRASRRSTVLVAVLAAAGLTAVSACGSATDPAAGPVRIVSGQSAQNGAVLQGVFDRYNTTKPANPVQLQIDNRTDAETAQKALADVRAGSVPDAVRVTNLTARAFVDAGLAQPLDTCLDSDPALKAQLDPNALTAGTVNGKLYEIPWYTTAPALFYNADEFAAAGLDPDAPPTTWSQVEATAAKLTDPAHHRFGAVLYFGNDYNFQGALRSGGGSMVDQAEKAATFNSAAGVATLRYWRDLVAKGYMPLYGNDFFTAVADGFTRGDVAMYLGSASSYDGLAKKAGFRVRLAPMPVPDGHQQLVPLSTNGFVMLATDPARQRATCEALLSLLRPDAVTDTVKATATIPLNTAAATGDQYLAGYLRDRPDLRMINSQPSFSWYALPGRANAEYQAAYTDTQNLVLRGAVDPQKGLDDLAARTTPLLTADAQGPR